MPRKSPIPIPRVFISATSGDLKSIRGLVKEGLLTMNCQPVEQGNFPPDYRSVQDMLIDKITDCQAVIHIVGICYGSEPDPECLPAGVSRRSYTQMEADIARRLGKKLFIFVCPDGFPYDSPLPSESEDLRALQANYRQQVLNDNSQLRNSFHNREDVSPSILELKEHLDETRKQLDTLRNRSWWMMAAFIGILLMVILGGFVVLKDQLDPSPERMRSQLVASLQQGAKEAHKKQLEEAQKVTLAHEREKLRQAANKEYDRSLSRIEELADKMIALQYSSDFFYEMNQKVRKGGVEEALKYLEDNADVITRSVEHDKQGMRAKLQTLVQGAEIARSMGRNAKAEELYLKVLKADPGWTEIRHAYWLFLVHGEGLRARTYGRLDEAKKIYLKSLSEAERLLYENPENPTWLYARSMSLLYLGSISVQMGNQPEAERRYLESLKIREDLKTLPSQPGLSFPLELSANYLSLGDLYREQRKLAQAGEFYQKALEIRQELAKEDPDPRFKMLLAVNYACLGDVAREGRDLPAARDSYLKALAKMEEIRSSQSANAQWQQGLAVYHACLGGIAMDLRDYPKVAEHYAAAAKLRGDLMQADKSSHERKRDFADSVGALADYHRSMGNLQAADEGFQRAIGIRKELLEMDSGNPLWQRDLVVACLRAGDTQRDRGSLDNAEKSYRLALDYSEKLAIKENAGDAEKYDVSTVQMCLGDLALKQGKASEALRNYQSAFNARELLYKKFPGSVQWAQSLAIGHHCLGDSKMAMGDLDSAKTEFMKAKSLLPGETPDPESLRLIAISEMNLGDVAMRQQQVDTAAACFEAARVIRASLMAQPGAHPDRQRDQAVCLSRLGDVSLARGDLQVATDLYAESNRIFESLLASHPHSLEWKKALAASCCGCAIVAERRQDLASARDWFHRADKLLNPLMGQIYLEPSLLSQYEQLKARFTP